MKIKKHLFRSFTTLVLLLSVVLIHNNLNENMDIQANTLSEFDSFDNEQLVNRYETLIYDIFNHEAVGNAACQAYSYTFRCQVSLLPKISENGVLKAWIKNSLGEAKFIGILKTDAEGVYLLEKIMDKSYLGDEIMITLDESKFATGTL